MANKLYRSRDQGMIAGICGGIGEYFGVDPTLIRLILVGLVFVGFSGILAYLIAWIIIPEAPTYPENRAQLKVNRMPEEEGFTPGASGETEKEDIDGLPQLSEKSGSEVEHVAGAVRDTGTENDYNTED
jgi:phage shock protein C